MDILTIKLLRRESTNLLLREPEVLSQTTNPFPYLKH